MINKLEVNDSNIFDISNIINKKLISQNKIFIINEVVYNTEEVVTKSFFSKDKINRIAYITSFKVTHFNSVEKMISANGNGNLEWLRDLINYYDLIKLRKKYIELEEQFKAFNAIM